ncbi:glycoside hydrolase family 15 protein [Microlunatus elymi]|uniref:Glycoside hydrolase family 15 protein n=1 Tax=Microlunatus elymi TaxID=2596828 RepID=A0A516Q223_9ACTN|nr:glycoside hydrolase family 15 protein [Microlunatus elymi]QDP97490.1 glycoside hydrolase family 15 protein [Microlunatus elymi]
MDPDATFPPHALRQYALLADGERGAVIGPRGDIAWLCAPRWDSPAVFSSLLGGNGLYAVTPTARFVWGGFYEDRSLIWRSRWVTVDGIIECREALAMPGDSDRVVLLRRILAVDGDAVLQVRLDLRADFGRKDPKLRRGHGIWSGTAAQIWSGTAGDLELRWSGGGDARPDRTGALELELKVPAGRHHDLILEIADGPLPDQPPDPDQAWRSTTQTWRAEVPALDDAIAARDAQHAYAVLRGMTSATGAMAAAATTSLPERAEQGRNYDYRYAWIRDQCMAGQALAATGAPELFDRHVDFVVDRVLADGERLRPAYTVTGEQIPDEEVLDVPGYPGGYSVTGNRVNSQFQLDALGETLLLFGAAATADRLTADGWRAAEIAAAAVEKRWREPEAGLWELENRQWTHSRLICVAGLRAVSAFAPEPARGNAWLALSERMLAETSAAALHPSGSWQRAPDDERVDAALLLPPLRGALPADDPRTLATLRTVQEELASDHYLYRFRQDSQPLGDAEGAFLLCGFTMAMALHQQGRQPDAMRWFERNRAACGPPGLFSEEYDVRQRQLRGNLPQAFVHAQLLEAAVRLGKPWPAGGGAIGAP